MNIPSPSRPRDHLRLFAVTTTTDMTEVTSGSGPTVRVHATDLRHAQQLYRWHREALRTQGRDPGAVAMVIELAVLVDDDVRSAQLAWARCADAGGPVLRYIGSRSGLRSLLDDIHSARVADGVALSALGGYNTMEQIVNIVRSRDESAEDVLQVGALALAVEHQ